MSRCSRPPRGGGCDLPVGVRLRVVIPLVMRRKRLHVRARARAVADVLCAAAGPTLQAIALLDTLDKDINTFVMRVREW